MRSLQGNAAKRNNVNNGYISQNLMASNSTNVNNSGSRSVMNNFGADDSLASFQPSYDRSREPLIRAETENYGTSPALQQKQHYFDKGQTKLYQAVKLQ